MKWFLNLCFGWRWILVGDVGGDLFIQVAWLTESGWVTRWPCSNGRVSLLDLKTGMIVGSQKHHWHPYWGWGEATIEAEAGHTEMAAHASGRNN